MVVTLVARATSHAKSGLGGPRGEPPTHNNQRPPACNHQAGIPGGTKKAKSTATSLQQVIRHNACVPRNHHSMRSGPSQRKITQRDRQGPHAPHIRSHLEKKGASTRITTRMRWRHIGASTQQRRKKWGQRCQLIDGATERSVSDIDPMHFPTNLLPSLRA